MNEVNFLRFYLTKLLSNKELSSKEIEIKMENILLDLGLDVNYYLKDSDFTKLVNLNSRAKSPLCVIMPALCRK